MNELKAIKRDSELVTNVVDKPGFGFDKNGKLFFIHSKLSCNINTDSILKLLNVTNKLKTHEKTFHLTEGDLYKHSHTYHLKQRAENDDIQTNVAMFFHNNRKLSNVTTVSNNQNIF